MNVVSLNTGKSKMWQEARKVAEDYHDFLISSGWGYYRIGEAHNIEPYYPAGKREILDYSEREGMTLSRDAQGIWTQDWVIDRLTDYLMDGGEFVI